MNIWERGRQGIRAKVGHLNRLGILLARRPRNER